MQEIVKGLWADPDDVTDVYHCRDGGCVGIHWGLKAHGKAFYTKEPLTADEFKKEAARIVGLKTGAVKPILEKRFFNHPLPNVVDMT